MDLQQWDDRKARRGNKEVYHVAGGDEKGGGRGETRLKRGKGGDKGR
jgi:hypothetical protein